MVAYDFQGALPVPLSMSKNLGCLVQDSHHLIEETILPKLQPLGIKQLHSFQTQAIESILTKQDTLVIAPTSGGKSMCYVGPALCGDGLVLVISPLIALMRDQMRSLQSAGIAAAVIDSQQSPDEKRSVMGQLMSGKLKLLFVSPERLALPSFRNFLSGLKVSLVAIDEAHCVNQWGMDFRPEYARIASYLRDFYQGPKLALTATATAQDRSKIMELLDLSDANIVLNSSKRSNLSLKFVRSKNQVDHLNAILQSTLSAQGNGIIYAATRKQCEQICEMLVNGGVEASVYHAGLSSDRRESVYQSFMNKRCRVIVATKAFGMGINKKDIRFVFHGSLPDSIETYCQEIGRAGRDGLDARCYLFFISRDYHIQKFMIEKSFPKQDIVWAAHHLVTEFFSFSSTVSEPELSEQLISQCGISGTESEHVISFFQREGVLKRVELVRDSWHNAGVDFVLGLNKVGPTLSELCAKLEFMQEEKISKLKSMYELAKSENAPESRIEEYFS